jgi:hypothetical protein
VVVWLAQFKQEFDFFDLLLPILREVLEILSFQLLKIRLRLFFSSYSLATYFGGNSWSFTFCISAKKGFKTH